jgi:hypothetical protein
MIWKKVELSQTNKVRVMSEDQVTENKITSRIFFNRRRRTKMELDTRLLGHSFYPLARLIYCYLYIYIFVCLLNHRVEIFFFPILSLSCLLCSSATRTRQCYMSFVSFFHEKFGMIRLIRMPFLL